MKFWICLVISVINLTAFSQVVVNIPLRSNFKSEPIKKNRIQSLVVFAEINESGIEKHGGRSGKILEIEFDSIGNMCYKLSLDKTEKFPFITFGSNNRFEYFNFDNRGELRYLYRENRKEIYHLTQGFNSEGNLIQSVALVDDRVVSNGHFEWRNQKMINFTDLEIKEEDDSSQLFYDDLGRMSQLKDDDFQILLDYKKNGDTVLITETIKDSDRINSIETYAYLEQLKYHYTSYTFTNEIGELEIEMKVAYDASGNATSYDLINRKENKYGSGKDLTVSYRIENIYDDRELLMSRRFYSTEEGKEGEILVRIEHNIYNSGPLIFKFEKCAIFDEYNY
ncbi:MAG: DUF244 domain-containing protein [Crocinitomicaceae bacterium]|nr:DUF244 domain-containing protein [Flavobacteriales bacterium]NQZ36101.1 DUF244 domain-containing protein [Crocinitomicaceae bacterium]